MVAFIIFWSATFAIIFFVLGIFFKGLASALNALLSSIEAIIGVGGLATLAGIALFLLYAIINGIINEGFLSVVGAVGMLLIIIGIFGAVLGGFGALILEAIVLIVSYILMFTSFVLEGAAAICEKAYAKFLLAIYNQIEKC